MVAQRDGRTAARGGVRGHGAMGGCYVGLSRCGAWTRPSPALHCAAPPPSRSGTFATRWLNRRSPPAPSPSLPATAPTRDERRLPSEKWTSGNHVWPDANRTFINSFRSSSAFRTHFYGTKGSRSGKAQLFHGQQEARESSYFWNIGPIFCPRTHEGFGHCVVECVAQH